MTGREDRPRSLSFDHDRQSLCKANGGHSHVCQDSHKRLSNEGSQIKPMLCILRPGRYTAHVCFRLNQKRSWSLVDVPVLRPLLCGAHR